MDDILNELQAERDIRQTVITLNLAFDEGDWSTVRMCLCEDFGGSAVVQSGQRGSIAGADKLLAVMKDIAAQRAGTQTMHVLGDMTVKLRGDHAEVKVFQIAYLYPANRVASPSSKSGSRGTYHLRREDGVWKVNAFDIDRVWLEGEPY
jgi:hypothetical protein